MSYDPKISDRKLAFGYWWVTHRSYFQRSGFVALIISDVLIIFLFALQVVWFVESWQTTTKTLQALAMEPANYGVLRRQEQPKPLVLGQTFLFPSEAKGRWDLVGEIMNQNQTWAVEKVTYNFIVNGEMQTAQEDFILPNEKIYAVKLAAQIGGSNEEQVSIVIGDVLWKKRHATDLPEMNFAINDKVFHPRVTLDSETGGTLVTSDVSAKVRNGSAYGFAQAFFFVIIEADGEILGARRVNIPRFLSEKEELVSVRWSKGFVSNAEASIIPHINILDQENLVTD